MMELAQNKLRGKWLLTLTVFVLSVSLVTTAGFAADWSVSEFHYQFGSLDQPFEPGAPSADTNILTLQHASGWKYGANFFFVDWISTSGRGYQWYGEVYPKFSLSKITGNEIAAGRILDVGVITGLNMDSDADVQVWFPGVAFALDIPGFAWASWDFFWTLNDNEGVAKGGAPKEDNVFFTDFNWATKQKEVLGLKWNIEGHIEYNDSADFEDIPGEREWWILAQPQLRAEIGEHMGLPENTLFAGIEYQWWENKLGVKSVDENAVQALVVWRL